MANKILGKTRLAAIMTLTGLLAACGTTQNSAPVVDRTPGARSGESVRSAVPVAPPVVKIQDGHGNYTVKKGDTLIRIALDHGQNYRDLVAWNNLANPNDIKVDQVLRVAPPESGSSGAQTASVATPGSGELKPSVAAVTVPNKNSPRGEKKAYSEAVLAELQKPDAGGSSTPATAAAVTTAPPAVPAASVVTAALTTSARVADKPAPVFTPEDESVSWIWPSDGKVVGSFDEGKNKGIDIAGKLGQHVLAAGSGKVMYAGSGIRGYGNLVIVKHSNNLLSAYAHNQAILVKEGQTVNKGQMIAEMGNSDSEAVMLHFEIRQQGKPVDPSRFLPNRTQ
jgi:lipoprotein NlpD